MALGQAIGGVIEVMLKFMITSAKMAKMAIFGRNTITFNTDAMFDVVPPKEQIEKIVSPYEKMVEAITIAENDIQVALRKYNRSQEGLDSELAKKKVMLSPIDARQLNHSIEIYENYIEN